MISRRARGWLLYTAAWVPIALVYGQLIGAQRGVGGFQAILSGLDYTLTPALLGVAVWWASGRLQWPARNAVGFFLAHILLALAYTILWLAVVVGSIALGTGWARALTITSAFAGWQFTYGIWAYGIIVGISYAIRIGRSLREKEAARARAEAARASAELSALRGQLNPHFLFNTLHTVIALVRRDPRMAEAALEQFGEMLRYVLDVNRAEQEDVELGDEMEFVRNFLALEQLRLGDRLRVIEDVSADTLDCVIPSLTLQPLVENAVKYAVAPRTRGGTIEIKASLRDASLVLEVADDGPGATNDVEAGSGVGLRAVRQRLEARYPGKSSFEILRDSSEGFAVRLMLPAVAG